MGTWNQKAKKAPTGGEGGEGFPKAPAGNHPAVLVALIDLGMQTIDGYQGAPSKDMHRAFFVWELVREQIDGQSNNHLIGIDLTVSLSEKAKLRKWIEARSGRPIPEGDEYDISQELGKPCLINIVEKKGYPHIEGISAVPKGMAVPKPKRSLFSWQISDFDENKPLPIPEWIPYSFGVSIPDKIMQSGELCGARAPAPVQTHHDKKTEAALPSASGASSGPPPRRNKSTGSTAEPLYWLAASDEAEPVTRTKKQIQDAWEKGDLSDAAEVCEVGKDSYVTLESAFQDFSTWHAPEIPF